MITNDALFAFPPNRPGLALPPEFSEAQKLGIVPVTLWNGSRAWLATRYNDVRTLLADRRVSANPTTPGFPNISENRASLVYGESPSFIRMDGADHARIRRMLTQEFTVQRVAAMRERTVTLVGELIDRLLAGPNPVDFVHAFAMPLPSILMGEILGVPIEDQPFFEECGARRLDFSLPPGESLKAGQAFRAYIGDLIDRKAADLGQSDDLVTRLIRDQLIPGNLSREEAVANIELLIIAGHETTAHTITLCTLMSITDHQIWDRFAAGLPQQTLRNAVEEMVRYTSVVQYMTARIALEDIEYNGMIIAKGEGILSMVNQANRDPSRFDDPDRFDPFREKVLPHVGFGFGPHQCLGQALARLELEVVFDLLPRRVPDLRLAGDYGDIQFKGSSLTHGVAAMPVTWGSGEKA